jgi:serine phosphatase RsbU (regulator of sigma subunit)/transcriptional regulator with GAF, ATPase, and Fis domain
MVGLSRNEPEESPTTDTGGRDHDPEVDRLALLRHAGEALATALDIDAALGRLAEVLVPALADWFSLDLLEGGTITNVLVMHPDPERVQLAKELQRRFPSDPDAPTGSPHVIRTGESELTEEITDEMLRAFIDDPELLTLIRELQLRCAMVVPLTARGRTIGSITMIGAETHERYGPGDLWLAEEIADRAALAIDTARLLEAENRARLTAVEEARRSAILQASTAAFGSAVTVDEVVSAMLDEGIRRAGAIAGTVGILEDDGRVVLRGLTGYQATDEPYWSEFRIEEPLPLAEAIQQRRPIVVSTTEQRDELYPALAGRGEQRDHALVCVPLVLGDEVVGGFSASYPPALAFGDSDLSLLLSIGEQCAQAVDRARAREAGVRARARLDAVAAASRALARTLDLDATIATAMRIAAEHLGGDASLVRFDRDAIVVEAGTPAIDLSVGRDLVDLVDRAREQGFVSILAPRPAGPDRIVVILPLEIAGHISGAVIVGEPTIDVADEGTVAFAGEIARRIARALENARLYRDRDVVARTLQGAFLPPSLPDVPGMDIDALFVPAERGKIGGDFFDVFPTRDGRWMAVVGDVCGKGIQAATLTAMARHTLRAVADVGPPSRSLAALNDAMLRDDLDGRFCTVALVAIEPLTGGGAKLTVSSGGHPLPQLVTNEGRTQRVGEHGTLLGLVDHVRLTDTAVTIQPGEALMLFTDGLIPKGEASAEQPGRLLQGLRGRTWGSAAEIREHIEGYVEDMGPERFDDIAVLVLRAA